MVSLIYPLISFIFGSGSFATTYYLLRRDQNYSCTTQRRLFVLVALCFASFAVIIFHFCRHNTALQFALDNSFIFMLLSVATIDLLTHYIYDSMLLAYSLLNGILMWLIDGWQWADGYGIIVGLVFYGIIYWLTRLFYKREAFGMGDVLLLAAVGVVQSTKATFFSGMLAFYVALLFLLVQFLIGGISKRDQAVAFAPSITIAAMIIYFMRVV